MTSNPLQHVTGFWKPLIAERELDEIAFYSDVDAAPSPGINVWRTNVPEAAHRLAHNGTEFALFAAVHPIDTVPDSAEVVADIRDGLGSHYSYVLWFPQERAVVVPFDPNAAIEALWGEKYMPPASRTILPQPLLSSYYSTFKPLLSAELKGGLRKMIARGAYNRERFLEWPTDQSLDLLQRFMLGLVLKASGRQEVEFGWFWPDRRPWAVALTHDVETGSGLARVWRVADMELSRGLRSSFNLVPLDYESPDSLVQGLREAGFEIGVHGYTHDGMLFSKWSIFLERVGTINEYGRKWGASGFRSPATYRNYDWFHLLEFEYDSSAADSSPFEPQPGGCATLFPFHVGDLVEMPVTLPQDHTIFGLLGEAHAQTWLTKLELVRGANGMACVLTHPDPTAGYIGMAENEPHYAALLDFVAESDAWTPLPRDLVRWWNRRAAASPAQIGEMDQGSFGTAVLSSSGRLEIVPPARRTDEAIPVRPVDPVRKEADRPIRVWIDMANSPHVQFFGPLIREMQERGHSVFITAREFAQTIELLEHAGLEYTAIGHHGGGSTIGKAAAIESRARSLASYARRNHVDVAVHHNSYAQAIAAWSSRTPSLTLMDYEYQPANHVSFRLSNMVLVPDSIPTSALAPYGASWRLRRYSGLKEDFYVASMLADAEEALDVDGLDPERPLLVLRPPPDLAIYHHFENLLWSPLLEYLGGQGVADVLVLPRTKDQATRLMARGTEGVIIADRAIAPATLLRHADGVITAGGTMAREAAALGIPAYTIFGGRLGGVDARLIGEGRLVEIRSADDFGHIALEKCPGPHRASLDRERERVSRLADLIVALAG